jgi:hypothetical protein
MSLNEKLLDEGPREAPEPETAEQRSKRVGVGTVAGGVVAGGAVLAKIGGLGKILLWLVAWHGVADLWRFGGWPVLAILLGVVLTVLLVAQLRRDT